VDNYLEYTTTIRDKLMSAMNAKAHRIRPMIWANTMITGTASIMQIRTARRK
jgi:hypothetical protein